MPAEPPPSTTAFKDWFDEARYTAIADALAAVAPRFDRAQFLALTLDGLAGRELMDRLRQTAIAADAALPGTFAQKLAVLKRAARDGEHSFVGIWFSEFVARFGLDQPDLALPALRHFTRFGSAEFAIRGFLLRDPAGTFAVMRTWAEDPDEHVRRLASEGSRPRLPWGTRLGFLVDDPTPTRPILEALKADSSLYVRKSVANHLNDIAKDHADYVVTLLRAWDRSDPSTAWITRHALRTLVKRGHRDALALLGAGAAPRVKVKRFDATPARLRIGERFRLVAELTSLASVPQPLIIDYVIHYVKASGATSAKVFKWTTLQLPPGTDRRIEKAHAMMELSTRRHYPGEHGIELQINGRRVAETRVRLGAAR